MDIQTIRNISPILVLLAFIGICWWAFAPRRKKRFEEAANLPFADEKSEQHEKKDPQEKSNSSTENDRKD